MKLEELKEYLKKVYELESFLYAQHAAADELIQEAQNLPLNEEPIPDYRPIEKSNTDDSGDWMGILPLLPIIIDIVIWVCFGVKGHFFEISL